MRKENDIQKKEEQQLLNEFYKKLLASNANTIGFWLLAGLMETFHLISMMVPYQEALLDKAYFTLPLAFGMLGTMLYLRPYCVVTEDGKQQRISEKLKYLPINRKELRRILVKRLFFFVLKIFPVLAAVQLLFAWFAFHSLCIGNFLHILILGFLWPFLAGLPFAAAQK